MTIASINAYTPSKGGDPSLSRTWASKAKVDQLEHQIIHLRERIAELERDFTYFHHHMAVDKEAK